MVCWLFVGSALFSAVFALHGGQGLIEPDLRRDDAV
jgi:TRAP-type mannitol/chloroaromatic compound transport system permease large subunit